MKRICQYRQPWFGAAAVLGGMLAVAGCNTHPAHPDEKSQVNTALSTNNLETVSVSQDQAKGVITLTGNVNSDDQKNQAATLAKQAAPDYTIANEIGIRPAGAEGQAGSVASNLDSGIEDNYKASLKLTRTSTTRASITPPRMERWC